MKVLIACEFSGIVRDAFIKKGHDAISCDLLPTERPGPHYQGDILSLLNHWYGITEFYFDLMISFPPCTHLSSAGAQYWPEKQKDGRQQKAIKFVQKLYNSHIEKIAIENPVGILSTKWKKWDQIINPFNFGDPYTKKTCLWLKNLPELIHTKEVEPVAAWNSGSYRNGPDKNGARKKNKLPVLYRDSKKRGLSFQGIADAMADQWG